MSTQNIPFSIYKRKSAKIIPNLQLLDFSYELKDTFEIAVENEPLVFEPLKLFNILCCCSLLFLWPVSPLLTNRFTCHILTPGSVLKTLNTGSTVLYIPSIANNWYRTPRRRKKVGKINMSIGNGQTSATI